jgi:hypothetical protein
VPDAFAGVLDLTVCNSTLLAEENPATLPAGLDHRQCLSSKHRPQSYSYRNREPPVQSG